VIPDYAIWIFTLINIVSMDHRLAINRPTTTSFLKNQFEIYCNIPSVLLRMKRFKNNARMVDEFIYEFG
jgi:hypothetical protein